MKNSCLINKIFVLSSMCLLWWRCSCDTRYEGEILKDHQEHEILSDASIGPKFLSTSQKEEPPSNSENVFIELTKEDEHSSVHKNRKIVNSEVEIENTKLENSEVKLPKLTEKLRIMRKRDSQIGPIDQNINNTDALDVKDIKLEEAMLNRAMKLDETVSSPPLASSSETDEELRSQTVPQTAISDVTLDQVIKVDTSESGIPPPPKIIERSADSVDQSQHPHSEAMPSFDEWKKMMLAEQEKDGHKMPSPGPPGKKLASQKRRRNYASYECGAKIVASNAEAEGTSRILNELVDEYMLNPCKAKIWFVLELCETVQASQIELANFELFSSCPKDFSVYSSDNFPTRDWIPLGTFSAAEQRVLQSFELKQEGFGKFIKIELSSYYGKEHYCPLSVVRIFGTSMVDEYEEMETLASHHPMPEDESDRLDIPAEDKGSTNIFGSATDAVINIVKKAAQVLVQQKSPDGENTEKSSESQNISGAQQCEIYSETQGSCTEAEVNKTNGSRAADSHSSFLMPPNSFHHSLFQHLRHCNQCIALSEPGYYSLSQPHCRFFQAALGPVLFKTVCDWFKDHQLVVAKETPTVEVREEISKTVPKRPPPSVISVIIDTVPESRSLPSYSDSTTSLPPPHQTAHDCSKISEKPNVIETSSVEPKLGSSIKPTKTLQSSENVINLNLVDKIKTETLSSSIDNLEGSFVPNIQTIASNINSKITGTLTEKTSIQNSPSSMNLLSSEILSTASVLPAIITDANSIKSDALQEDKMMEDDSEMSTIDVTLATTEAMFQSSEDFSEDMKNSEEKFSDGQKEGFGKLEVTSATGATVTVAQKESVFMRMNNRIKALELNMSLSSQYLQELSQRYRRQMEEMQRAFNRTIGTLNDTAKKAAERDVKQQEVIGNLQSQVTNLTQAVDLLLSEKSSLARQMIETHVFLMVAEAIIMITVMSLCVRRISSSMAPCQFVEREITVHTSRSIVKRRSSSDTSPSSSSKKVKKRSFSEETLSDLLIIEPAVPVFVEPAPKVKKKNHRKKNKGMQRSISIPSMLQRTNSQTSLKNSKVKKDEMCAAGVIFCHTKSKPPLNRPQEKPHRACENCHKESAANCGIASCSQASDKEKRTNSAPLKNLTNGGISSVSLLSSSKEQSVNSKEKFSLKKFLKFQKRDSI